MRLRVQRRHEINKANYSGLFLNPDFGLGTAGTLAAESLKDGPDARSLLELRVARLEDRVRVAGVSTAVSVALVVAVLFL